MYGFGGIPPYKKGGEASHCFTLNGLRSGEIHGLQETIQTYKNTLPTIQLHGPTLFSPLLQTLRVLYEERFDLNEYTCITILTDGVIHDMSKTKNLVVDLSKLPVSLIIIGIGDEDFSQME